MPRVVRVSISYWLGLSNGRRDPPSAFLLCERCGAFGEFRKSLTLAAKCKGRPASASVAYGIQRVRNGLFPRPGTASKNVAVTSVLHIRLFGESGAS